MSLKQVACVQAAEARERWREEQGAMSFQMPEAKVRVVQPHSPASIVQVHASSCATGTQPSQRLVSEMMILTGQAIAHIGKACTGCLSLVSSLPVNLMVRRCQTGVKFALFMVKPLLLVSERIGPWSARSLLS